MLASCSKQWSVLEVTRPFKIEKKTPAATNIDCGFAWCSVLSSQPFHFDIHSITTLITLLRIPILWPNWQYKASTAEMA